MKVKELKEWLNQFNDNDEVDACDYEGDGFIEIKNQGDLLHPKGVLENST